MVMGLLREVGRYAYEYAYAYARHAAGLANLVAFPNSVSCPALILGLPVCMNRVSKEYAYAFENSVHYGLAEGTCAYSIGCVYFRSS